jgi:hypothetical protein
LHYTGSAGVLSIPDSRAKKEWVKANTQRVVMNLNKHTDEDIIKCLETVPSKQGYIKTIIRKDMVKKDE